jgi:hypothetical protein
MNIILKSALLGLFMLMMLFNAIVLFNVENNTTQIIISSICFIMSFSFYYALKEDKYYGTSD